MGFRIEENFELAAPIEAVFSLVTDPALVREWRTELLEHQWADARKNCVGATFFERAAMIAPRPAEYPGEVTHWIEHRELGVRLEMRRFMCEVIYRLTPLGDSRTKLRYICHTQVRSRIIDKLMGWHIRRVAEKMQRESLMRLKATAERDRRAPS